MHFQHLKNSLKNDDGELIRHHANRRVSLTRRTVYAFILSITFLFVLWGGGFFLFNMRVNRFKLLDHAPSFLIPAAVLTGDNKRIQAAVALLKEGKIPELLISGADADPKYFIMSPVNPKHLTLGTFARNTLENAFEINIWTKSMAFKEILLLTSDYHLPRALLWVKYINPHLIKIHPRAIPYHGDRKGTLRLGEYHKYLMTHVFIMLRGLFL
jgi:uncharacterized SAM-binding protein YcdF (DUF218 family)